MTPRPKCWRCKGSGKTVETEYNIITNQFVDVPKTCWRCGGTGKDK